MLQWSSAAVPGVGLAGFATGLTAQALSGSVAKAAPSPDRSSPNERPVFGFLGTGIRFRSLSPEVFNHGPAAAVCDVDSIQVGRALQRAADDAHSRQRPINTASYEDYRHVLDRNDIDAVVICSVDHWHTKMAIDAMRAGKDVYCEKPLTLTIREGQQILQTIEKTGRVFQVGTMQRTLFDRRFAIAAAMLRAGRIGKPKRVTTALGQTVDGPSLPAATPPKNLNWDLWLGQAPEVEYRQGDLVHVRGWGAGYPLSRAHRYFRWWYEYSGGRMTDWGTHHVDCALWALDRDNSQAGPMRIEPIHVVHPVPLDSNGMPTADDRFNTATRFHVRVTFQDGVELDVRDDAPDLGFDNGIMFQGEKGRFFVNRGKLTGKPVEQLVENPLPEDALDRLYGRKVARTHVDDFVECMKTRNAPVSDVESHHRSISLCHAINIALRLGRALTYDPASERFVNDPQANGFIERKQRKGYEIVV